MGKDIKLRNKKEIYESVITGNCCAYSRYDCDKCKLVNDCGYDDKKLRLIKKAVHLHDELLKSKSKKGD